jgi:hypothetical protein
VMTIGSMFHIRPRSASAKSRRSETSPPRDPSSLGMGQTLGTRAAIRFTRAG